MQTALAARGTRSRPLLTHVPETAPPEHDFGLALRFDLDELVEFEVRQQMGRLVPE